MSSPSTSFTLAGGPGVRITVLETAEGTLRITAAILPGAVVGDLRGLFFHLGRESLLGGLAVSAATSPVTALQQAANGVGNLGAGVSLAGATAPMDIGLAFGTASASGADDIRSVSFTLSHASQALSLHDIDSMLFGVQLGSVGASSGLRIGTIRAVGRASANSAPVAHDDSQHVLEDGRLQGSVGALASDAQNNVLGFSLAGAALPGLSFHADGRYEYTPPLGFSGLVQFQYKANDGVLDSNVATVRITVDPAPVNHAPVVGADRIVGVEDGGAIEGNLSLNDSDPDGDPLVYAQYDPLGHATAGGTLQLDADGHFIYRPYGNFNGEDYFLYVVDDGHGSSSIYRADIEVASVNDAPVVVDQRLDGATEDASVHAGLWATDPDDLPATLSYRVVGTVPEGLELASDGRFAWNYPQNVVGELGFRFEVTDPHGASAQANFTLTVVARNDPPVANPDEVSTPYATTVLIHPLLNDTDEEGDALRLVNLTPGGHPAHGTAVANSADGTINYTPEPDFWGVELLGYYVADDQHSGLSNPGLITITVLPPPNEAPVAGDDEYTFDGENPTFQISPRGLLGNDTDRRDQTLTIVSYTQPDHGQVVVGADGGFTYTAEPGYLGATQFRYVVSDGELSDEATVVLLIVDNTPAVNDRYSTNEDQSLTIAAPGVLGNDLDLDRVVSFTQPAHATLAMADDGSFVYTPHAEYHGDDSFRYTATSGIVTDEATVALHVAPVNDLPVLVSQVFAGDEDGAPIEGNLALADSDPDGDALIYRLGDQPVSGSLVFDSSGRFSYRPDPNFYGTDSFLYFVGDGHAQVPGFMIARLDVYPANDPPQAFDGTGYTLEDGPAFRNLVAARDPDDLRETLRYRTVGPVPEGLEFHEDGFFSLPFPENFIGELSFGFEVEDPHGLTDQAIYTLRVEARNDAPVAVPDQASTAYATAVVIHPVSNDTDEEGSVPHLFSLTPGGYPPHGEATVDRDTDTITYTPAPGFWGVELIGYYAYDEESLSNPGLISVTVAPPPNEPPVAGDDEFHLDNENPSFSFSPGTLLANDSDRWDQTLRIVSYTQPEHGSVTVGAEGGFSYLPEPGFVGRTSFGYVVSDGELSDEAIVRLVIEDSSPAQNDAYATLSGQVLVVAAPGLLANDLDLEAVIAHTQPAHGTLALAADGGFVYTPDAGFVGTDSFRYTAAGLVVDDALVSISVAAVPLAGLVSLVGGSAFLPREGFDGF